MKDFVKKHFITIVCLIFVVVGGIIAGLVVPNLKKEELAVSVKSVTVSVGDKVELNYSVNRNAVLTFSIEDETVANIEETTDKIYVVGIKVGTTKVKVVAQLGDLYCSASARVLVVAQSDSTEPENPDDPDDPTPPEGGDGEGDETSPNPEEGLTMQVSFPDMINCSLSEGKLICDVSKIATVSISVSVDAVSILVESSNEAMTVVKNDMAGRTVYKLSATEAGEYVLTITATGADGKLYKCNYNVVFQ